MRLSHRFKYYVCSMENKYMVTCFVFRVKTEKDLIEKIQRQEIYGWYFDSITPIRDVDTYEVQSLLNVGAHYVR